MSLVIEDVQHCPQCHGEITFGYGLAGGGQEGEQGKEPGVYWMCLDCEWMGPTAQETVCFPHGLVQEKSES
jgi:hypothetical protein